MVSIDDDEAAEGQRSHFHRLSDEQLIDTFSLFSLLSLSTMFSGSRLLSFIRVIAKQSTCIIELISKVQSWLDCCAN